MTKIGASLAHGCFDTAVIRPHSGFRPKRLRPERPRCRKARYLDMIIVEDRNLDTLSNHCSRNVYRVRTISPDEIMDFRIIQPF
jgi:hypothetical protein